MNSNAADGASCVGMQQIQGGLSGRNILQPKPSKPITVKEVMQQRADQARKALEQALFRQVKAETLGINDWPYDDLHSILNGFSRDF